MPLPPDQAWFAAKTWGCGWGLPRRWQGWLVMFVYIAGLGVGVRLLRAGAPGPFLAWVLSLTALLIGVCWWKGEAPRWRWGDASPAPGSPPAPRPLASPLPPPSMPPPSSPRLAPPIAVWWVVWSAVAIALLAVSLVFPSSAHSPAPPLRYLPLVPLLAASGLRWVVLPKLTSGPRAFPLFVIGLSLAEGSAILGLALVPDLRETYIVLGLLGVAQYAPAFARRYARA